MERTRQYPLLQPAACRSAPSSRPRGVFAAAALLLTLGGCYNGEALVLNARSTALSTRLAEIDLGKFHTTLPRDPNSSAFAELRLHLFGAVPRSRLSAVKKQLSVDEYRVRHEMLAAMRTATGEELAEPSLTTLRERIERVLNDIFSDAPIKSVGFYEVMLRQG